MIVGLLCSGIMSNWLSVMGSIHRHIMLFWFGTMKKLLLHSSFIHAKWCQYLVLFYSLKFFFEWFQQCICSVPGQCLILLCVILDMQRKSIFEAPNSNKLTTMFIIYCLYCFCTCHTGSFYIQACNKVFNFLFNILIMMWIGLIFLFILDLSCFFIYYSSSFFIMQGVDAYAQQL